MKQRKETTIKNAFTINTIVTVYHLKMPTISMVNDQRKKECLGQNHDIYDFWQLIYLESGYYTCNIGGSVLDAKAGQLLLAEPGKARITVTEYKAVTAIVSFRCNSEKMQCLKNRIFSLSEEEKGLLSRIIDIGLKRFKIITEEQEYYGQQPEEGTEDYELQALKNNLELLLISLYEHRQTFMRPKIVSYNQNNYYKEQFGVLEKYLKENIRRNITVEDIVINTGFSASTIKRICANCTQCGVIHYFITLKMEEAKRLIRESDMTMSQISECLGFSGIHYFSRMFKERTGLSPSQYARSILKG